MVISCRINHFGKNPDVGGSPPRAMRTIIVRDASVGVFSHEVENLFILVEFKAISVINIDEVKII